MSPISFVMACFSLFGALDLIFGNKVGVGKQFERGIMMIGTLAMSMAGMLILAPLIAHFLRPAVNFFASFLPFEPAVIPAMILANDMGGASLAMGFASNEQVGYYNALIISAMMGATISFNIPFAMGVVLKEKHKPLLLGLLCGIVTTPVGCLISGFIVGLPIRDLLASIAPLLICAAILAVLLFFCADICVKAFKIFGHAIKILIIVGLMVGVFEGLTGIEFIPYTAPIEDAMGVCVNAALVMSGAFPLVYLLSRLLDKPMKKIGDKVGINSAAALGFLSTLATNVTTYGNMQDMDEKGTMLNAAFSVSAGFVLADHLAFTLAFNADYAISMIVGKLISGVAAIALAVLLYEKTNKSRKTEPKLLAE